MKQYQLTIACPKDLGEFHNENFLGRTPSYSILIDGRYLPATRLAINLELDEDEAIILALKLSAQVHEFKQ